MGQTAGRIPVKADLTILFTDLVEFSNWSMKAGDAAAVDLLRKVSQAIEPPVAANTGKVVKRLGDGIMAVFADPSDALAREAQARLEEDDDPMSSSKRVAVIGAGMAGLAAGLRLTEQGHDCDVYERWPGLGGQVATLDLGDGTLLERYYHHLSRATPTSLRSTTSSAWPIEWLPVERCRVLGGRSYAFTTPLDLLRFRPLPAAAGADGLCVCCLQRRHTEVEPFESDDGARVDRGSMGREAWDTSGARCCAASSESAPTTSRWRGRGAS